jgi:hypothetical protein
MRSIFSIVNGNIHIYKLTCHHQTTFLWWRDATPTIKKGNFTSTTNGNSHGGRLLEEDHLIETHLKDHRLIHLMEHIDGHHLTLRYGYPSVVIIPELTNKLLYIKLQYPTYVKDIDLHAHIKFFKKTIKANGETMEIDINMFGFTLKDNILKWGENFVQDHRKSTF